ncbi:DNA-binding GntR family transcriptional regulator [Rhizobium brockwellii]
MIEELRRNCIMYSIKYDKLIDETPSWLDDHEKITRAYIEKRTDDAAGLLKDHIEGARKCLLGVQTG